MSENHAKPSPERMPTLYVPHGGGPWPFVELGFGRPGMWDSLERFLRALNISAPRPPTAVLVVSAHWEAERPTVMASPRPPMLYDYYGFPAAAYEVRWPAPGQPELAAKIHDMLERSSIPAALDPARGYDHGAFVVTALSDPAASIPTLQLSLKAGLDPAEHLEIGRSLAPLRDEGVLILGSGMSYHNMRGFRQAMRGVNHPQLLADSRAFDDWLVETVSEAPSRRSARLVEWERAPAARACHPREEHLLPLMVVAGAAGDDPGAAPYRDRLMGVQVSAARFG